MTLCHEAVNRSWSPGSAVSSFPCSKPPLNPMTFGFFQFSGGFLIGLSLQNQDAATARVSLKTNNYTYDSTAYGVSGAL
ncbi:hypothetical protein D3OALGA1CA_827 [Olavius algarvensis associated proteobacterium Delta 3]|nr:hypothetical protein D3OALGA1CA_827 [Olavius algarvensis associated proteobacterium Delta 3]CAB5142754.1 hypothetical protein D3OALGB2SA_4330 [Olavius algarvensis associated proteobacterium Delta 3]